VEFQHDWKYKQLYFDIVWRLFAALIAKPNGFDVLGTLMDGTEYPHQYRAQLHQ
jgi:hypothetical protein